MQSLVYDTNLTSPATVPSSKATRWVGRIVSALPVLFLVFDGVIKVLNIQAVVDGSILLMTFRRRRPVR